MKPVSVEIYPVYICPDCHSRYCESMEYVRKVSKILCACGKVLALTPIKTFNVSPVYQGQHETPPKTNITKTKEKKSEFVNNTEKAIQETELDESIGFLVSLGWKKGEAKKKVLSLASSWKKENKTNINRENSADFANYLLFNHSKV